MCLRRARWLGPIVSGIKKAARPMDSNVTFTDSPERQDSHGVGQTQCRFSNRRFQAKGAPRRVDRGHPLKSREKTTLFAVTAAAGL
jgi:hypothetical protein